MNNPYRERKSFPVQLIEIGPDPLVCIYSCFCPSCALASARSTMDGSSCCFNWCCISPIVNRVIMKQAYSIEYNVNPDCMAACCCWPCAANQQLQSAKMLGPIPGFQASDRIKSTHTSVFSFGTACYTICCLQCAMASALQNAMGIDGCIAYCCVSSCAATNIIRYHNNVAAASDVLDDCIIPTCYRGCCCFCPCCFPCMFPFLSEYFMAPVNNANMGNHGPYLNGTAGQTEQGPNTNRSNAGSPNRHVVHPQTAAPDVVYAEAQLVELTVKGGDETSHTLYPSNGHAYQPVGQALPGQAHSQTTIVATPAQSLQPEYQYGKQPTEYAPPAVSASSEQAVTPQPQATNLYPSQSAPTILSSFFGPAVIQQPKKYDNRNPFP
jgi:Cys-rich protein (TIGR01571 family)